MSQFAKADDVQWQHETHVYNCSQKGLEIILGYSPDLY